MVCARVKTEFVDNVITLCLAPCDTHDATARLLGKLTHNAAHRSRCGIDDDGFTGLGLTDVEQPGPGGNARHAEHAKIG